MCGISGIFTHDGEGKARHFLSHSLRALSHRGPDHAGHFIQDIGGGTIGLGHTLLSIMGDKEASIQPCVNSHGALVFNGAIYNYMDLGKLLQSRGIDLSLACDTHVLLAGLNHEGFEFIDRLRGMFSFAYLHFSTQELWLVRDPFGVKPLYWAQEQGELFFASEYKAILPHLKQARQNKTATADYLQLRYVPGNATLVHEISKVEKGCTLIFRLNDNSQQVKRHFFPNLRSTQDTSLDELFHSVVVAIKRRAVAKAPVAALLSGGIDSSLVCDFLQQAMGTLETFSLKVPGYDETALAEKISTALSVRNHSIEPEALSLQRLQKLIYHLDDPYGDPIIFSLDRIFNQIPKSFRVIVTGEGADEMFSGYVHHRMLAMLEKLPFFARTIDLNFLRCGFFQFLRNLVPYSGKLETSDYHRAIARWNQFRLTQSLSDYRNIFSVFDSDQLQNLTSPEVGGESGPANLKSLRMWDFGYWLPDSQCFKMDKLSMRHSIEAREPFIDRDLFEVVSGLKIQSFHRLFQDKVPLRHAVSGKCRVPHEIVMGRKTSFFQPIDQSSSFWTQLGELIEDQRAFLSEHLKPDSFAFQRRGLLSQKKAFVLASLILWKEEIFEKRSSLV